MLIRRRRGDSADEGERVDVLLISVGIVCILAAIAGGSLKALNIELPALHRPVQYFLFGAVGIALFSLGLYIHYDRPPSGPAGITIALDSVGDVTGSCPGYIKVAGTITITEGQGTVHFHGVLDDSASGESFDGSDDSAYFSEPGTQQISNTIEVAGPMAGYYSVQVTDPVQKSSDPVPFAAHCSLS
jgi:hypothetical protein